MKAYVYISSTDTNRVQYTYTAERKVQKDRRLVQNAKTTPENQHNTTRSLREPCITSPHPPFVTGDDHREKKQQKPTNPRKKELHR